MVPRGTQKVSPTIVNVILMAYISRVGHTTRHARALGIRRVIRTKPRVFFYIFPKPIPRH